MPGHKGQPFLGCEALDITEVQGADALFEADGILLQSEEHAAALFGCLLYTSSQGCRGGLGYQIPGIPFENITCGNSLLRIRTQVCKCRQYRKQAHSTEIEWACFAHLLLQKRRIDVKL